MADSIRRVDPKTLIIAPNVRTKTKITKTFVDSIKQHGVKVPIEVHPVGDALEVLDGQRRTLAAIEAELVDVPVLVTAAPVGDENRIVDQLVLNEQRERLTQGERIHAVQELALIGVAAGDIAKRTSVAKADVEKAIKVANSAPAIAAVEQHEITLDQAAELVEFEGHPAVLKDLIERARSDRQFDYAVREARKKISLDKSKKDLEAKLKKDGVPKVKEADYYSYSKGTGRKLDDLTDANGKKLTAAAHKKCPGHAAYIFAGYYAEKAALVYVCSDWEANGHKQVQRGYVETAAERNDREKREKKRAELEQAREISRELRAEFLASLLQRDVAKLDDAHSAIAEGIAGFTSTLASRIYGASDWRETALGWLGVTVDEASNAERTLAELLDRAGAKPLTIALAASLALQEYCLEHWNNDALRVEYFGRLEDWGYSLTDYERDRVTAAKASLAEEAERQLAERAAADAKAADAA